MHFAQVIAKYIKRNKKFYKTEQLSNFSFISIDKILKLAES